MELLEACLKHGRSLDNLVTSDGQPADGARLLWAIAGCESDFGRLAGFVRHEPAYMPGGQYYQSAKHVRDKWHYHGVLASCSYGAFQVLYIVAYELGFVGHPTDLLEHDTCAEMATALIQRRIYGQQRARTIEDVLDAYNSGNFRDANRPQAYVAKGVAFYRKGL